MRNRLGSQAIANACAADLGFAHAQAAHSLLLLLRQGSNPRGR
jgi:hypothetical protein